MTRESLLAWVERRGRAWRDRNAEALAADYADDAVLDSPIMGKSVGREAIRLAYETYLAAFGELTVEREDLVIDGAQLVMVFKVTGTHTGSLFGIEGTGEKVALRGVSVWTVEHGKIAHERRLYDFTGFLVKVGVLKARPLSASTHVEVDGRD